MLLFVVPMYYVRSTLAAFIGYSVDRSRRRRCRMIGLQSSTVITVGSGASFLFRRTIGNKRECALRSLKDYPQSARRKKTVANCDCRCGGLRPRNLRDFVESRPNARPRIAYEEQRGLRSPGTAQLSTLLKLPPVGCSDTIQPGMRLFEAQHHCL